MTKDLIYVFDKLTKIGNAFGEIQNGFNMSFVIDGTKDSCSINVLSLNDEEIEPYTIIYHKKTSTWWIVSHDKVERYANENGFIYKHILELLGSIELLNARDLTDCGFNDNFYSINSFITRLFNLSNFEYNWSFSNDIDSNFLNKKIDFIKTFENYTLLSALRELLDAFNMCPKLSFSTTYSSSNDKYTITQATLLIISKTGNFNNIHYIDEFDDVRETKTIDKNSFGTTVVSNAENVISSKDKTFPSCGVVGFTSDGYEIDYKNAYIRLPNNVYKLNWLKLVATDMLMKIYSGQYIFTIKLYYDNDKLSMNNIDACLEGDLAEALAEDRITQAHYDYIANNKYDLLKKTKLLYQVTFYSGIKYLSNDSFVKPDNVPYIPYFKSNQSGGHDLAIIICPKDVKQCMKKTQQGIAWERGSNKITGFEFLEHNNEISMEYTDGYAILNNSTILYQDTSSSNPDEWMIIYGADGPSDVNLKFRLKRFMSDENPCLFVVNYTPMSNLKIKVDNQRTKNDIQIYNQNGKLNDSYAFSKLLNSYSKEISSNSITRYMHYFDFNNIPKEGDIVVKDNVNYVISNLSINFTQNESINNESFSYFIECEITMSKYITTKSLLVNPNTNIRDYGIPQNFNVKRKQLYRDYYELAYRTYNDANLDDPYLPTEKVFNFTNYQENNFDYVSYIKITFDQAVEGKTNWYYQLDMSTFVLNKQLIVICDFIDNNIIGYSQMNKDWVLDVSNLFNQNSLINTPISYVDDNGRLKDFDILVIKSNDRLKNDEIYYNQENISQPDYDALLTQVFIPDDLFNIAINQNNYDTRLQLQNYNKDALEVPVFEFSCQIEDSDDVLIGDGILKQYDGEMIYFYSYVKGTNLTQDNVSQNNHIVEEYDPRSYELSRTAKITNEDNELIRIKIYSYSYYNRDDETWHDETEQTFELGYDYAFFRHSFNLVTKEETIDLLFIAKKIPFSHVSLDNKTLSLEINYYKLR